MLTDALGLDRAYVVSMQGALPATRFAVEAYVNFVRERTLLEAVASSLTELFAPAIHRERISGMLENYDFVGERAMQYFRRRLDQADRDADFALDYVKRHAATPQEQAAAVDAVRFKCNVLWAQLDALHHAYVTPGLIPPGAFRPEGSMSERRTKRTRVMIGAASMPSRCRGTSSCATTRRATAGPSWRRSACSRRTPSPSPCCSCATACARVDDIADELAQHLQRTEGADPGRHRRHAAGARRQGSGDGVSVQADISAAPRRRACPRRSGCWPS